MNFTLTWQFRCKVCHRDVLSHNVLISKHKVVLTFLLINCQFSIESKKNSSHKLCIIGQRVHHLKLC
jgi:hypothetical protein